jgi:N-acetylneuraminic acid mutarotase/S-adenosylmethionine hydrolase
MAPADYRVTAQLQVLATDGGGKPGQQVIFFESGVADYQVLQKGLAGGTDAVVLDGAGDGLAEMAAFLQGRQDLSAIHIVSHGAPGALELGTAALDEQALQSDPAAAQALGAALAPGGDLLLWGCDVGAGRSGKTFLRDLADASGANVAAATEPVGAADLGGGWKLSATVGNVRTADPFSPAARAAFPTLLPWIAASAMSTPRSLHTATLLANGKVLVTGGYSDPGRVLSTTDLYDPASNTWSAAGSMRTPRAGHTATLLANGKVLVTGGSDSTFTDLSSAELYDPASNTWSAAAAMSAPRYQHTATLLANGKVLVAGGSFNARSAELYDPGSNTWSAAGSMSTTRQNHTATLLANGMLLVTGGSNGAGWESSAELYDPANNSWSRAASMSTAREYHTATLLPSGKVLVTGGRNVFTSLSSAELYDPGSNTWSAAAAMSTVRADHKATLLANGNVLVAGGSNGTSVWSSAELYDQASNTWSAAGSMDFPRAGHMATLLANGNVLVAGGYNTTNALSSAELYVPDSGQADHLVFLQQPTSAVAGQAISPAVTVEIVDQFGNLLTNDNTDTITVAIGTNPGGGTLSGTLTVTVSGGVATFADLSIDMAGAGYTLVANGAGLPALTSDGFAITPAAADHLAFTQQPTDSVAGQSISPAVTVAIVDQFGNVLTGDSSDSVTVAIGTNPSGGTLSGTLTVTVSNGVATFGDLSINMAGSGYTLVASSGVLTGATSNGFAITPAAADHLLFLQQPTDTAAGQTMGSVIVEVVDQFGNVVTSDNTDTITLSIGTNPSGGTLSGTLTLTVVNGVATFSNLSIDLAGSGYTLHATVGGGLPDIDSNQFNIF